jgi:hypothetical protein
VISGAIELLRRVAARLSGIEDADAGEFAARLAEYEAGARHGLTLGAAFGLTLGRGETPWWQLEASARRDEILRDLAARYFPSLRQRRAATALMQAIARYEASGWRQHRRDLSPPAGLSPLQRGLFTLLKLDAPLSVATVRRALAHEIPLFVSQDSRDAGD